MIEHYYFFKALNKKRIVLVFLTVNFLLVGLRDGHSQKNYDRHEKQYLVNLDSKFNYYIHPQTTSGQDRVKPAELSKEELENYLNRLEGEPKWGDQIIEKNDKIEGDLVVLNGYLRVLGEVDGNILVVGGDLSLRSTAMVKGNVYVYGGRIYSSKLAKVEGALLLSDNAYVVVKDNGKIKLKKEKKATQSGLIFELKDLTGVGLDSYNRVDGLGLDFGFRVKGVDETTYPRLDARAIYRVGRSKLGYEFQLKKSFFFERMLSVGVNFHSITNTNDEYRVGRFENSLAAFFFKEDFFNYFEQEGFSVFLKQQLTNSLSIRFEYDNDEYKSLQGNTPFTLFGAGKNFRGNPPIDDGDINSLVFKLILDTRDRDKNTSSGWLNKIEIERAGGSLEGEFEYTRLGFDIRRYNRFLNKHQLDFRLKLEGAFDPLPLNKYHVLGGVGGMRGFKDFEFFGDRLILGNVEYRYSLPVPGFLDFLFIDLQSLLFFDFGTAFRAKNPNEFSFSDADFKKDIGIGLTGRNILSYIGIYLAKELDSLGRDPRLTFRIKRDF